LEVRKLLGQLVEVTSPQRSFYVKLKNMLGPNFKKFNVTNMEIELISVIQLQF